MKTTKKEIALAMAIGLLMGSPFFVAAAGIWFMKSDYKTYDEIEKEVLARPEYKISPIESFLYCLRVKTENPFDKEKTIYVFEETKINDTEYIRFKTNVMYFDSFQASIKLSLYNSFTKEPCVKVTENWFESSFFWKMCVTIWNKGLKMEYKDYTGMILLVLLIIGAVWFSRLPEK